MICRLIHNSICKNIAQARNLNSSNAKRSRTLSRQIRQIRAASKRQAPQRWGAQSVSAITSRSFIVLSVALGTRVGNSIGARINIQHTTRAVFEVSLACLGQALLEPLDRRHDQPGVVKGQNDRIYSRVSSLNYAKTSV